jgi:hypothetical protein
MKSCLLLPLLFGSLLASSSLATAQTLVDITAEAHHHLLLENDQARVFSVTLHPFEQAFVKHEHNFLWIALANAELVIWAEGSSPVQNFRISQGDVRFYLGGHAIGLRNDRTSDYHGVIIEFLSPKVTTYGYQYQKGGWDFGSGAINPPVDPHAKFVDRMSLGAASASDVQLLAGDSLPPPQKEAAELLVPITEMDLKLDGDRHIRKSPGEAVWIPPGRRSALENPASGPARFVYVELQTQPAN